MTLTALVFSGIGMVATMVRLLWLVFAESFPFSPGTWLWIVWGLSNAAIVMVALWEFGRLWRRRRADGQAGRWRRATHRALMLSALNAAVLACILLLQFVQD